MNYLKVIAYSLALIPLWGMWLMDNIISNTYLVFLSFIVTAISFDLMRDSVLVKLPKAHQPLVFLGPAIYLTTLIILKPFNWLLYISQPILWISIFFFLNYKYLHNLFPFAYKKWMVILGFALFYTTSMYPYAKITHQYRQIKVEDKTSEDIQSNDNQGVEKSVMPVDNFTSLQRKENEK